VLKEGNTMNIQHSTILLIGGSSGIGKRLAEEFHKLGSKVIITGRNVEAMRTLEKDNPGLAFYELDVRNREEIKSFSQRVLQERPDINVLFNNAGIMRVEDLTKSRSLEDAEETITTNLLGPIRLIDAFIDHLASKKDAAIVNTTSGLAFVPLPSTPTYSATKAALHSYTESLRKKLEGKVQVVELAPPGVQTELTPGQSTREGYMPLEDFIQQTLQAFTSDSVPDEVVIGMAKNLRTAEIDGKYGELLSVLASH
jgi:uncharacterized oxidoreductase